MRTDKEIMEHIQNLVKAYENTNQCDPGKCLDHIKDTLCLTKLKKINNEICEEMKTVIFHVNNKPLKVNESPHDVDWPFALTTWINKLSQ